MNCQELTAPPSTEQDQVVYGHFGTRAPEPHLRRKTKPGQFREQTCLPGENIQDHLTIHAERKSSCREAKYLSEGNTLRIWGPVDMFKSSINRLIKKANTHGIFVEVASPEHSNIEGMDLPCTEVKQREQLHQDLQDMFEELKRLTYEENIGK